MGSGLTWARAHGCDRSQQDPTHRWLKATSKASHVAKLETLQGVENQATEVSKLTRRPRAQQTGAILVLSPASRVKKGIQPCYQSINRVFKRISVKQMQPQGAGWSYFLQGSLGCIILAVTPPWEVQTPCCFVLTSPLPHSPFQHRAQPHVDPGSKQLHCVGEGEVGAGGRKGQGLCSITDSSCHVFDQAGAALRNRSLPTWRN